MTNQITISGVTGNPPYDVYVCDITNTYCYLITGSTLIPPTLIFNVPPPLEDVDSLLVKITDISGCTRFINYSCPPTPTPSGYALSAGTEYFMCEWCPGEMPTAEAVPHAVYSNAQGRSVIQENSVALGGFNGLNS